MIKKYSYQDIDFEKYEACIANAVQRKFYAEKIFLDTSCHKQWELLVYGDYEAVMPVPYIKKFGVKIVINPKLCQQLGIFSREDSIEINDKFLKYFCKKYVIWYYGFNDVNRFTEPLRERKNFLIYPEPYEVVRQRYSPKRKRKLRLDQEVVQNSQMMKNPDIKLVRDFIDRTGLGTDKDDLQHYISLLLRFHELQKLDFYGFFYHHKLINLIAVYKETYSVALLGTYNEREYVKLSGSSYLIDKVIEENIAERIFDFEGSEVPAVEEFFRGFRPVLRPYRCIANDKISLLKQLISKIFSF